MCCKTYETTNEALGVVIQKVNELIKWADADAQHAEENAPGVARDDRRRGKLLRRALVSLRACRR